MDVWTGPRLLHRMASFMIFLPNFSAPLRQQQRADELAVYQHAEVIEQNFDDQSGALLFNVAFDEIGLNRAKKSRERLQFWEGTSRLQHGSLCAMHSPPGPEIHVGGAAGRFPELVFFTVNGSPRPVETPGFTGDGSKRPRVAVNLQVSLSLSFGISFKSGSLSGTHLCLVSEAALLLSSAEASLILLVAQLCNLDGNAALLDLALARPLQREAASGRVLVQGGGSWFAYAPVLSALQKCTLPVWFSARFLGYTKLA